MSVKILILTDRAKVFLFVQCIYQLVVIKKNLNAWQNYSLINIARKCLCVLISFPNNRFQYEIHWPITLSFSCCEYSGMAILTWSLSKKEDINMHIYSPTVFHTDMSLWSHRHQRRKTADRLARHTVTQALIPESRCRTPTPTVSLDLKGTLAVSSRQPARE